MQYVILPFLTVYIFLYCFIFILNTLINNTDIVFYQIFKMLVGDGERGGGGRLKFLLREMTF